MCFKLFQIGGRVRLCKHKMSEKEKKKYSMENGAEIYLHIEIMPYYRHWLLVHSLFKEKKKTVIKNFYAMFLTVHYLLSLVLQMGTP